ncbi:macrophage mannose receptor 1-like [Limulus polyphemus]|uniref:Macrophage mannose receptor 1-like n=1 Tax=Limulus polyphemus TaxID=6850 RepID=A0ABM1BK67_LIMPO|nr:macrophage mannose receptor 1-like [Limulus polyphemus]
MSNVVNSEYMLSVQLMFGISKDTKTKYVIVLEDSTFENAIQHCKEKGGFLATISNERDRKHTEEFIKQMYMSDNTFWLGISDRNKERFFESVNGEVIPFLPSFWAKDQPDNGGGTDPTCARLEKEIGSNKYFLNDVDCRKTHYGICEIPKEDKVDNHDLFSDCENEHEDYCYELLAALHRDFSTSNKACENWYDGQLAKISNLNKLLYFSELILNKGKENEDYWVGLTDRDRKGLWKFIEGTEAPFVPELWFDNEPNNNVGEKDEEDCVVATFIDENLLLEDRKCSDSYKFICVIRSGLNR